MYTKLKDVECGEVYTETEHKNNRISGFVWILSICIIITAFAIYMNQNDIKELQTDLVITDNHTWNLQSDVDAIKDWKNEVDQQLRDLDLLKQEEWKIMQEVLKQISELEETMDDVLDLLMNE